MNIAYETGASVSLCPHPQPKLDTQSVTASGQWTTSEPTSKRYPIIPESLSDKHYCERLRVGAWRFGKFIWL